MTDRDRLAEQISNAMDKFEKMCAELVMNESHDYIPFAEFVADYLLSNGVIVPPCKVGDKVCSLIFQKGNIFSHFLEETYVGIHLSNAPDIRGHRRKNYIIVWNENTNSIRHIDIKKIGKTVFLTKEVAEEKLKCRVLCW